MGNGEWEDLWDVGCGQGESGKWNGRRGKRREWGVGWKAREEERVGCGMEGEGRGESGEWGVGWKAREEERVERGLWAVCCGMEGGESGDRGLDVSFEKPYFQV